jgi:hypothetical protein
MTLAQIVGPAALDVLMPAGRVMDPELLGPEEGLDEEDAADRRIFPRLGGRVAAPHDSVPHRLCDAARFLGPNHCHAIESGIVTYFLKKPPPAMALCGRLSLKRSGWPSLSTPNVPPQGRGYQKFTSSMPSCAARNWNQSVSVAAYAFMRSS